MQMSLHARVAASTTAKLIITRHHFTQRMSCNDARQHQASDNQHDIGTSQPRRHGSQFSDMGLEELRQQMRVFAAERNWEQFHTPRNLLLALVGEVGELSEIFQWRGEVPPGLPGFSPADRAHVGQELSDVLLYLVRLADVCGVDLGQAVRNKMAANAAKYPAEHCRGSAAKYTAYAAAGNGTSSQQQQQQQGHDDFSHNSSEQQQIDDPERQQLHSQSDHPQQQQQQQQRDAATAARGGNQPPASPAET